MASIKDLKRMCNNYPKCKNCPMSEYMCAPECAPEDLPDMTEPKLKPCPFCGSTKLKIDSKRTFNYNKRHCSVTVRCMKCHARSPVVGINLEKNQHNERELCESQVTEAWNKRVVL